MGEVKTQPSRLLKSHGEGDFGERALARPLRQLQRQQKVKVPRPTPLQPRFTYSMTMLTCGWLSARVELYVDYRCDRALDILHFAAVGLCSPLVYLVYLQALRA